MAILQLDEFKRETLIGFVENLTLPFESKTLPFYHAIKMYSVLLLHTTFSKRIKMLLQTY